MYYKNYILNNVIGNGICGIVYSVFDENNKEYALKIEKITQDEQINKNLKIWREINFYNNIGNKYPDYFIKYYNQ